MSGLAALLGPGASHRAVETMLDAAPHRGTRKTIHADGDVAVGVTSREGEHPYRSPGIHVRGRVVTVSAGCLHRESSLITGGEAARRIGEAFLSRGIDGVAALRGSFAAVVVPMGTTRAFAIRTPLGEFPLFARIAGPLAAFASEVKQTLAAPMPAPGIDTESLLDLVALRFERPGHTAHRGIRRVRAGQWTEIGGRQFRDKVFWDPYMFLSRERVPFQDAVAEFRRLFHAAVARRLHHRTALLLSGGMDSSAIAAVAAPLHAAVFGEALPVVSAAYPDHPEVDESGYIRSTIEALGARITWVRPRPRPFTDPSWEVFLHDGPCMAPLSSNARPLLAAAREAGHAAVLDGHDGDGVLGGERGVVAALVGRLAFREVARYLRFVRRRHGLAWDRCVRRYLVGALLPAGLRSTYARWRGAGQVAPPWALDPLASLLGAPHVDGEWFEAEARNVDGSMELAMETIERVALAEGMDALHPFADRDLVEFLLSLPPEVKFASGSTKSLIREGYPELPPAVIRRADKTAFDPLMVAGATEALSAIRGGPRALPGVDWVRLEARVKRGALPFSELALLLRVVQADRLLAGP
jgi:asparagine synthase (glutamine-hydrolysing)